MTLAFSGTIEATSDAATFTLNGGASQLVLIDDAPASSPQLALSHVLDLVETEDWPALYARIHPLVRPQMAEAEFVAGMSAAFGPEGTVTRAEAVAPPTTTRSDTAWWTAQADIEVDMLNDGRTASYPSSVELVFDGEWWLASLGSIDPDNTPPTSNANPLPADHTEPASISFEAIDDGVGVSEVEVWWRYRPDAGSSWSIWSLGPAGTTSPVGFEFVAGEGDYEFYTVAVDNAGNREAPPGEADAATRFVAPTASWSASERLNDGPPGGLEQHPSAVVTSDGVAVVAWTDRRADADIYVATRDLASGGAWSTNVRVNDDATTRVQEDVDLAAGPDGEVLAAWVDRREGSDSKIQQHIYAARRDAAGVWSANVRVDADPKGASKRDTAIAVGPGGEAVAVWRDLRGNKQNIYSARLALGGDSWGPELVVTDSNTSSKVHPEIVIGPDGTAHAVWTDHRTGGGDIYYASLAQGALVWSANVKISDDPGTALQSDAQIAVGDAGDLLVVWSDRRSSPTELRYTVRPAGGTWAPSQAIPTGGIATDVPALAMLPTGRALLAWPEHRGTWVIYGSEWDPALGQWSPAERIDDATMGNQRHVSVALWEGRAVVAYMDDGRDWGDIRAQVR